MHIYVLYNQSNRKMTEKQISLPQVNKPANDTTEISWEDLFTQLKDLSVIDIQPRCDNLDNSKKLEPDKDLPKNDTHESIETKQTKVSKYQNLENTLIIQDTKQTGICNACGDQLYSSGSFLVCKSCGLELQGTSNQTNEDYSASAQNECNVNDKGFISMRVIGKGSYGYNRNLLKSCANYSQYRKMNTLKEMHNWNAQSTTNHLPKNVIEEANNMFAKIKEKGHVYRKDVKKGVQSACLYYACYNNNISKTPNEIAQIVGIAEKFHSSGDRILRDLNERRVIDLPAKVDPIVDYVERYFELLNINKKYRDFVLDLIYQANKEKLHVLCDSKNNTKCIGAIYMLIDRVPELRKSIDKDTIDKECEISKTTFMKYYILLCKYYRKFVPIFAKHKIPMKLEWKESISDIIEKTKKGTLVDDHKFTIKRHKKNIDLKKTVTVIKRSGVKSDPNKKPNTDIVKIDTLPNRRKIKVIRKKNVDVYTEKNINENKGEVIDESISSRMNKINSLFENNTTDGRSNSKTKKKVPIKKITGKKIFKSKIFMPPTKLKLKPNRYKK
jgi:transcription initiation factor TFIIIB Brf1 subunit/transcription initiation factor TFIIB